MDPVANIQEQVILANRILEHVGGHDGLGAFDDDAGELAELVIAQNEWRIKGGFDPYETIRVNATIPAPHATVRRAQALAHEVKQNMRAALRACPRCDAPHGLIFCAACHSRRWDKLDGQGSTTSASTTSEST